MGKTEGRLNEVNELADLELKRIIQRISREVDIDFTNAYPLKWFLGSLVEGVSNKVRNIFEILDAEGESEHISLEALEEMVEQDIRYSTIIMFSLAGYSLTRDEIMGCGEPDCDGCPEISKKFTRVETVLGNEIIELANSILTKF